ncbi:MAG: DUF21 domain-containing protein [Candidatus Aegiribacteria sp.]|nr:DUF21 domain-containing protein [Candidatus Aegiribacteria sp.]
MIILFLLALALTAFCSGSETAFSAASRIRAYSRLREGKKRAGLTLDFIEHPRKYLTTTLVGTNVGMVLASAITSRVTGNTGISWLEPLSVTILVFFILIVTEMIPKQMMLISKERVVSRLSFPLFLLRIILFPVVLIADFLSTLIVGRRIDSRLFESKSEILGLLTDSSSEAGPIAERVLRMNDIMIGNVMRTLRGVPYTCTGTSRRDILEKLIDTGYPFVLVREKDGETIRGYADRASITGSGETLDDSGIKGLPYFELSDDLINVITGLVKAAAPAGIVLGNTGQPVGIAILDDIVDSLLGKEVRSTSETGIARRIEWIDGKAVAR